MKSIRYKQMASLTCIITAIVFAFMGFFTPPTGEISESVLWFVAQCLIFSGSLIGVDCVIDQRLDKHSWFEILVDFLNHILCRKAGTRDAPLLF